MVRLVNDRSHLEALTEFEDTVSADEQTTDLQERFVNIVSLLMAYPQPSVVEEPGRGGSTAVLAEAASMSRLAMSG